jgi:transcriptional regulator with XRE-family HTH domain
MRSEVNMAALGLRLAYARRQWHLRQADLAREVGIHAVTLSRIEHGKLPGLTVAVLARLAMRLDMSFDQLLQWHSGPNLRPRVEQAPLTTVGRRGQDRQVSREARERPRRESV